VTSPATRNPTSSSRRRPFAAGDFNGDGKPDLVGFAYCCGTMNVLLNEGGGKFGNPTSFATTGNPVSLATGDLDGNGLADVVVGHFNPGGVALHLAGCP
jgi:hypothetical protein